MPRFLATIPLLTAAALGGCPGSKATTEEAHAAPSASERRAGEAAKGLTFLPDAHTHFDAKVGLGDGGTEKEKAHASPADR